jgi:ribonuclease HI
VKWQLLLAEFDITFVSQKSIKAQAMADHLAELPLEDYQPLQTQFPDEHLCTTDVAEPDESEESAEYKLYFDGAVNKKGRGIGAVLETPQGRMIPTSRRLTFKCSNNMAEYEACIMGLKLALDCKVRRLHVYGDALLIISQENGDWKTRDPKLLPYHQHLLNLAAKFDFIKFISINRHKNAYADALATLASWVEIPDNQGIDISISKIEEPAYCFAITEVSKQNETEGPWYHDIKIYLKTGEFPTDANATDRKTIIRLASRYVLGGDSLYKKSYNQMLLRCLNKKEAGYLML